MEDWKRKFREKEFERPEKFKKFEFYQIDEMEWHLYNIKESVIEACRPKYENSKLQKKRLGKILSGIKIAEKGFAKYMKTAQSEFNMSGYAIHMYGNNDKFVGALSNIYPNEKDADKAIEIAKENPDNVDVKKYDKYKVWLKLVK